MDLWCRGVNRIIRAMLLVAMYVFVAAIVLSAVWIGMLAAVVLGGS